MTVAVDLADVDVLDGVGEGLSPAQRRTLPARQAMARKFATKEERSAHFSALARRRNAQKVLLSLTAEEAEFFRDLVILVMGEAEVFRKIIEKISAQLAAKDLS